jgi:hypothetical protein
MSTTHHQNKIAPTGALEKVHCCDVVALDTIRKRNRLHQLLATRRHLATMAAQQRSHAMEDAQETVMTLCAIESTIRDEYPEEFEQSYPQWLVQEVADEHPAGVLTPECGICCSIAAYSGVNLVPPEAA